MQSRRDLLKTIGAGVASTAVLGTASAASRSARAASLRAFASGGSTQAPWCLLAPLRAGQSVGKGWSIEDLSPVRNGASILQLTHRNGDTGRVHLCARSSKGTGVAHTHLLDLILMDGGDGGKPTNEGLGRVIRGLAKRIAKNEVGAVEEQTLDSMSRMLTHQERMALYGPENLL